MIISFLSQFLNDGGQYVSWKNNNELDLVLSGQSDLDIYVPMEYKRKFCELARRKNWISVINPVADYPEIYHFFSLDKELRNYHLHVYFKITTGESWLKEYNFPIGDFLIKNRVQHQSGIYILNKKAQSFLFVLRHFAKGFSFFSRMLYKNELKSYEEEWSLCRESFAPDINKKFLDFTPYMEGSGLNDNSFYLPEKRMAKAVRSRLKPYLRLPKSKLNWLRLMSLKERINNRLFLKRKKTLSSKGFILAFSGADGVGKSTMSETISKAYGKFLTIRKVQLGRPQSGFIERLRKLLNKKPSESSKSLNSNSKKNKPISLKKAVSATVLSYLRYKEAQKALRFRKKGYLVFSDRWPTLEYSKMDGPQLPLGRLSGIKRRLAQLEKRYYDRIIDADLCVVLTVPTEVAIQRNRDRIKEEKETDDEIRERHEANAIHQPKAERTIRFDNNGNLEEKRNKLIEIIQSALQ